MRQNVLIDTKDGKVKLQFDHCETCSYYEFCYVGSDGKHHKGVPHGLNPDCMEMEA